MRVVYKTSLPVHAHSLNSRYLYTSTQVHVHTCMLLHSRVHHDAFLELYWIAEQFSRSHETEQLSISMSLRDGFPEQHVPNKLMIHAYFTQKSPSRSVLGVAYLPCI